MKQERVEERVIYIVGDHSGREDVTKDSKYDELGLDSLDMVELCIMIEEEFEIEISDNEFEEVEKYSVQYLIDFVKERV